MLSHPIPGYLRIQPGSCPPSCHPSLARVSTSVPTADRAGDVPWATTLGLFAPAAERKTTPPCPPDGQHHTQASHLQNDPGRQGRQKAAVCWELKYPEKEKCKASGSFLHHRCPRVTVYLLISSLQATQPTL